VHADEIYDIPRCRHFLRRRGVWVRVARNGIDSSERLGHRRGWTAAVVTQRDGRVVEGKGTTIRRGAIHALMQLPELALYPREDHEPVL
jgi:hypothetical protein